jgi:hypothetical protein
VSDGYELTDVLAERRLEAIGADGSRTAVTLSIGRPFPDPLPGGDWCCCFRVSGLGDGGVRAAFGVDSLQALLLAIYRIQLELAAADGVRLEWLGMADLGLHVDPTSATSGPAAGGR